MQQQMECPECGSGQTFPTPETAWERFCGNCDAVWDQRPEPATDRTAVQPPDKRALRRGALEPVDRLVSVLVANGLTPVEACKAVRWAAHVIEGREAREAENISATGMHYDDPVFEQVTE